MDGRMGRGGKVVALTAAASLVGSWSAQAAGPVEPALAAATHRVSVGPGGVQGNSNSAFGPAVSADGLFVAFTSVASNLVAGDTNAAADVFVRHRLSGVTRRVSVSTNGRQGNNGGSAHPAMSADGRLVAFTSDSSNLVSGDTNDKLDVFVRDLEAGVTRRVSVGAGDVQANDDSIDPAVSADGRFVAFVSAASNLTPGDTNGSDDVFVRDLETGVTARVSLGAGERQANSGSIEPAISADGRLVAFASEATNLVAGDTNDEIDVFVRDTSSGVTRRVSVDSAARQADGFSHAPAISADGRFVAFHSQAADLVTGDTNAQPDVFVRDRWAGVTQRASVTGSGRQANASSESPTISADGRFVAFSSAASNLVVGDTNAATDVFLRDRLDLVTLRISVGVAGRQANGPSTEPVISADGGHVVFHSAASNLVPGDTNRAEDMFVRDR